MNFKNALFLLLAIILALLFVDFVKSERKAYNESVQERRYLRRMLLDFEYDWQHLNTLVMEDSGQLEVLIGILDMSERSPNAAVGVEAISLLSRVHFAPQRVTYDLLLAEGKFGLLREEASKNAVGFLYQQTYPQLYEADRQISAFTDQFLMAQTLGSVRIQSMSVSSSLLKNAHYINALVLLKMKLESSLNYRKNARQYLLLVKESIEARVEQLE